MDLLLPDDLDRMFLWRPGTAWRLAKRGQLPYHVLPNGEFRFELKEILPLVKHVSAAPPRPVSLAAMRKKHRYLDELSVRRLRSILSATEKSAGLDSQSACTIRRILQEKIHRQKRRRPPAAAGAGTAAEARR